MHGSLNKWGNSGSLIYVNDIISDNEVVIFYNGNEFYDNRLSFESCIASNINDSGIILFIQEDLIYSYYRKVAFDFG